MNARLIKQAPEKVKVFNVGDKVSFGILVPLQNIGTTIETVTGTVIKVNRISIDVETSNGSVYRADQRDKHTKLI